MKIRDVHGGHNGIVCTYMWWQRHFAKFHCDFNLISVNNFETNGTKYPITLSYRGALLSAFLVWLRDHTWPGSRTTLDVVTLLNLATLPNVVCDLLTELLIEDSKLAGPSLVQMMLFGAKPLSQSILVYFQLDLWKKTWHLNKNAINCHQRKCLQTVISALI